MAKLPPGTILDGELVAIGADDRSGFNLRQNFRAAEAGIRYYAFDLLALKGKSLLDEPLQMGRTRLNEKLGALLR